MISTRSTRVNAALSARAAIAARHAQRVRGMERVAIVDWDVHHGNGTQRIFWNDSNVLYISLHRYENGTFYPGTTFGNYDQVGGPDALGTSVNVPWPCTGMGDADYLHAFQQCILPIAYEFAPDLVIVSAGFDAADGDVLGGCRVSPTGYAHMTHQLAALAGGRLAAGARLRGANRPARSAAGLVPAVSPKRQLATGICEAVEDFLTEAAL